MKKGWLREQFWRVQGWTELYAQLQAGEIGFCCYCTCWRRLSAEAGLCEKLQVSAEADFCCNRFRRRPCPAEYLDEVLAKSDG